MTCLDEDTLAMLDHSAERFIETRYGFGERQQIREHHGGHSPAIWTSFARMGWLGIPFSEAEGGLGGDVGDTLGLMRRFGRALVTEPYMGVVGLSGQILAGAAEHSWRDTLLPELIAGRCCVDLAWEEPGSRGNPAAIACRAEADGSGFRLSGGKITVLGSPDSAHVLVAARSDGSPGDLAGIDLFLLPADSPGLERETYPMMDGTPGSNLRLAGVAVSPRQRLTRPGEGGELLSRTLDGARVMLVAEALGIMETLIEKTVTHLNTRKQFGTPLSTFQVLQHRVADMYLAFTGVESLYDQLRTRWRQGRRPDALDIARLKSASGIAGRTIGQQAVQLHGGIGMTDELDIGHYFKRLTAIDILLGGTEFHIKNLRRSHFAESAPS